MILLPQQVLQRTARSLTFTSPVGGWNTRDPLDRMPLEDAVEMTNFFPDQGSVKTRNGYSSWADTLGGAVETLAEFNAGATNKFIAAANGNIWDISSSGAGSSLASGFTNDRWQWAQFDDSSGGARMGLVNGADTPQIYDGSTVSNMTISGTGLTVTDLVGIHIFKNRSFFWESDSQDFWYSASEALGGSLTNFPLGRVSGFGGNLIAMGTLTIDGGIGIDDHACFFMSSGDILVYAGTDPGSDWALVGIFRMGAPMGPRAVTKFGGDLLAMTDQGYMSISAAFGRERGFQPSISDKISDTVKTVTKDYRDNFGWQVVLYPREQFLLFNVPVSSTQWDQHVYNFITNAWCKFEGMNGSCWAIYDNDLYFGDTSGNVQLAYQALNDGGSEISAIAQQAWTYLGDRANNKRITSVRPFMSVNTSFDFSVGVGVDFKDATVTTRESNVADDTRVTSGGDTRVTSDGDTRVTISNDPNTFLDARYGVLKEGRSVSLKVTAGGENRLLEWFSTNITYEQGSIS